MTHEGWSVDDFIACVDERSPELALTIASDAPFGRLTTYRVGGTAACAVEINSVDDLILVGDAARECGAPVSVLGRGSNTLVSDSGWHGVVVTLGDFAEWIHAEPADGRIGDPLVVEAGGSVALPVLSRRMASLGIAGLEWMVGVPGSIGGAVRMNAGGHGSDMADSLIDVDVVDLKQSTLEKRGLEELGLAFRSSALDSRHVVVSARLSGVVGDGDELSRRVEEIVKWRREHQPGGQNCGSVFVNPVPGEVSAGELIDNIGLRGFRIGTAEVSAKHANFIQADIGGLADDVMAVMDVVRERVREATGFSLRSEVQLFGFNEVSGSELAR